MVWYIFIHPAIQLSVLILGIINLNEGFNQKKRWTFSVHKHGNRGFIFAILAVIGAIVGWLVNQSLENPIQISGHRLIAFIIFIFLILVTLSGLLKRKHSYRMRWLQFLHPWFGFITIGLIFAQLFVVMTKIIGW
jgi:hypothetical protein